MSKIKLLPCPFCGREATTSEKEGIKNIPHGWGWIGCRCCRVFMNYSHGNRGKQLAIEAWNTRKPMERIVEQLEEEIELKVTQYPLHGRYIKKTRAIEIVRKGGAE